MNYGHAHQQVTEHTGTKRNHHKRGVKTHQRFDTAQEHESNTEHHNADTHQTVRAEAIHQPAKYRTQKRNLCRFQGGCSRQGCLTPAALFHQHSNVNAECLIEQHALQKLQSTPCSNNPPAVKYFPHEIGVFESNCPINFFDILTRFTGFNSTLLI
jgi:hypothetical protein